MRQGGPPTCPTPSAQTVRVAPTSAPELPAAPCPSSHPESEQRRRGSRRGPGSLAAHHWQPSALQPMQCHVRRPSPSASRAPLLCADLSLSCVVRRSPAGSSCLTPTTPTRRSTPRAPAAGTHRSQPSENSQRGKMAALPPLYMLVFSHPCSRLAVPRSRVCNNRRGIIRKYGLDICRRCFREYAADIGFTKYR